MKRTAIQPSAKPMSRTSMRPSRQPIAAVGILGLASMQKRTPARKVAAKAKQSGKATAAERRHMGKVAANGCVLCEFLGYGYVDCEVHHVRVKHGWGRSGHFNTIGLCAFHHRGEPGGVHSFGRIQFAEHYGISELQLLDRVNARFQTEVQTGEVHA